MVIVKTKDELKNAVSRREHIVVADKKLANKLMALMYVKKDRRSINSILECKTGVAAATILAPLAGIPVSVAITLIVTIGIITVVAILCDYRIVKTKDGDIELEPA